MAEGEQMKLLLASALLLVACSSPTAPQEIETQDERACYMGEPVRVLESYEMTSVVAYDQRQDTIYADTYLLDEAGYCW
jgi:outer membrane biogenesis lipoprotein LolB